MCGRCSAIVGVLLCVLNCVLLLVAVVAGSSHCCVWFAVVVLLRLCVRSYGVWFVVFGLLCLFCCRR